MISEYTPAVERALEFAQRWAHSLNAEAVQPLHLLLGLLEEEEGRVATMLRRAGLDLTLARQELGRGRSGSAVPLDAALPALSTDSAALIREARSFLGYLAVDEALTTEQILLALLHGDESLRRRLVQLGLSWEQVERAATGKPLRVEEPLPIEESLRLGDVTERMDSARILDACFNRACEALRVIEDHCRFVLDDALLCGELKRLRHDLAEALARHDPDRAWHLAARETLRDVGADLTTTQEYVRESLLAVIQANWKRLQEALRSLEEFGKLKGPPLGRALEEIRYRTYTLERALFLGAQAHRRLADVQLYLLVSGSLCAGSLERTIAEAVAGGVQMIQLREKQLADRDLLQRARAVRQWTRQAGVLFIVNDRPDIARLVAADGVHLGQDELPVKEVRRIVGPDAMIGVSTHNIEQVRRAVLDGASYLGIGPTFPSRTKEFEQLSGLDFIRQAVAETSLPAFAIGGINRSNIGDVIATGARRVAVSQAICQADDPQQVARELRALLGA